MVRPGCGFVLIGRPHPPGPLLLCAGEGGVFKKPPLLVGRWEGMRRGGLGVRSAKETPIKLI